ncbi:hypothetical protein CDAR_268231 [Caerostris darwini]|uniref:Uncharacterized protein n=1 Tax=Caerostris darwini TaxID=1538125 RepID=A0AAV4TQ55_9ARAC|nr:hypothetical protein CDAR_268231 [Caerostris darwini]
MFKNPDNPRILASNVLLIRGNESSPKVWRGGDDLSAVHPSLPPRGNCRKMGTRHLRNCTPEGAGLMDADLINPLFSLIPVRSASFPLSRELARIYQILRRPAPPFPAALPPPRSP